jgi:Icc protein
VSVRLLVVSDHHLGPDACAVNRGYAPAWALDRVLDAIASAGWHGADALLSTGDLVDRGDDAEYAFARELLGIRPDSSAPGPATSTRPGLEGLAMYLVPGNHDARDAWIRNLFPDTDPAERLDFVWSIGDQTFVHLDTGRDGRAGVLLDASLDVLDAALTSGRRVVLVLHHHPVEVGVPWLDRALPEGVERLWRRLEHGVIGVLFGHAHESVDAQVRGVPVLGTRATCFQFARAEEPAFVIQPLEYRVVTVEGPTLASERYTVPLTGPARPARAA